MNQVNLIGNLTKDTTLTYTSSGAAVLKNGIAVRRDKDRTDFINIVAFKKTAELIANHFQKGSQIGINGSIITGSYENQEGRKVYTTDVMVSSITFINGNKQNEQPNSEPKRKNTPPAIDDDPFATEIDDSSLPF